MKRKPRNTLYVFYLKLKELWYVVDKSKTYYRAEIASHGPVMGEL
jgi:hypothetical protein